MKFAHKMICLLVLVLSASFGLGGCWLLYSDFAVQRRTVLTADAALHSQICTDVQTDLLDRQRRGLEMGGAVAAARLALHQQPAALWQGEELVSSKTPWAPAAWAAARRAAIFSLVVKIVLSLYAEC